MDPVAAKAFVDACWAWDAAVATSATGSAPVAWALVRQAAMQLGAMTQAEAVALAEQVLSRQATTIGLRAHIAALQVTLSEWGAAGGGAAAGTATLPALLIGLGLCIVVGTAMLGVKVAAANARDARNARTQSMYLYEQYQRRWVKFWAERLKRNPRLAPEEPMSFEMWLQNQGTKITVLR